MRPKQIRVFDGLRVTTEHINHLQDALYSGFQDFREIHGLGRVYYGFQVESVDNHIFAIQPGLAFDYEGNRLVCDEPKTVEVVLEPQISDAYVCLKYEQLEEGQVEGHYTLIWDSCSAIVRSTLPELEENLVPLAKIVKANDGRLQVESLLQQHEGKIKEFLNTEGEKPEVSNSHLSNLQAQLGVVRFPEEALLSDSLRAALTESMGKVLGNSDELLFPLAEKEISTPSPISNLTCHIVFTLDFRFPLSISIAESGLPTKEVTEAHLSLRFQSTAHGEVVFAVEDVSQFGISNTYSGARNNGLPFFNSELTELGVASLSLRSFTEFPYDIEVPSLKDFLRAINFLIRVDKASNEGFKIICYLVWTGGRNEDVIKFIEAQDLNSTWEAAVAWKAIR